MSDGIKLAVYDSTSDREPVYLRLRPSGAGNVCLEARMPGRMVRNATDQWISILHIVSDGTIHRTNENCEEKKASAWSRPVGWRWTRCRKRKSVFRQALTHGRIPRFSLRIFHFPTGADSNTPRNT